MYIYKNQSVVVRLKDTQPHQPSSLRALYKDSLCLKARVLQQELSSRLGLSQGRLERMLFQTHKKDITLLGLYPQLCLVFWVFRTFCSMPAFLHLGTRE